VRLQLLPSSSMQGIRPALSKVVAPCPMRNEEVGIARGGMQKQTQHENVDVVNITDDILNMNANIMHCLRTSSEEPDIVPSCPPEQAPVESVDVSQSTVSQSTSRGPDCITTCSQVSLKVCADAQHAFHIIVNSMEADFPAEILAINETTMSVEALAFEEYSPVHLEVNVRAQVADHAEIIFSCLDNLDVIKFQRVFQRAVRSLAQGGCCIRQSSRATGATRPVLINDLSCLDDELNQFEVDGTALICTVLRETASSDMKQYSSCSAADAAACLASAVEAFPKCREIVAKSIVQRADCVTQLFASDRISLAVQYSVSAAIRIVSTTGDLPTQLIMSLLPLVEQLILVGTQNVVHRELKKALHGLHRAMLRHGVPSNFLAS